MYTNKLFFYKFNELLISHIVNKIAHNIYKINKYLILGVEIARLEYKCKINLL